ncbi:MAG: hypothetical protein KF856_08825 [Cyclobacteriaceae bacterium]|nr:hypothetical protein [Cyclobacteriaceae bacterium]
MESLILDQPELSSINLSEMVEINGGDWNKGFAAGEEHGYSAGKGILAGLTVIGIIAFFL